MSRPVSQDGTRQQGKQYTDEEWERVREPFYHYYIEKNMSLKQAARVMAEKYNFEATLRQWERRIAPEKWNMPKYANREERLKQIQDAGKSLLEVSNRGRRRSTASDGRPSLNEDRNLRRFARREISREPRPRAKSVNSVLSDDLSDQEMDTTSAAPSPSASDMYLIDAQHSAPFPSTIFEPFTDPWLSGMQPLENVGTPHVIAGDHDDRRASVPVPQIFFSGPGDELHMVPEDSMAQSQSQPQIEETYSNVHGNGAVYDYAVPSYDYVSTSFEATDSTMHDVTKLDETWLPDTQHTNETFPSLAFGEQSLSTNFASGPQSSYSDPAPVLDTMRSLPRSDQNVQEQPHVSLFAEDELPDLDNTHTDVHDLLQNHYRLTSQMIAECLHGCENVVTENTALKEGFVSRLRLLQNAIQAQSKSPVYCQSITDV